MTNALPAWARREGQRVVIDGDRAYPELLKEVGGFVRGQAQEYERLRREANRKGVDEAERTRMLQQADQLKLYREIAGEFTAGQVTQYALEVVYQFAKLDLRRFLLLAGESPWPAEIRIKADKARWGQAGYQQGRGVAAASQGRKESRRVYYDMRRFIPN